jgi:hypothetical protein
MEPEIPGAADAAEALNDDQRDTLASKHAVLRQVWL